METLSSKIINLSPSLTLSVAAQAKELQEQGQTVFSFTTGEPDADTPEHIKEAAIQALKDGQTKYLPSSGLPQLREALAEKLLLDNETEYTTDQIIVSCGAKHACFNAILATCEPGDEVVIPSPYWTSYPEIVRMAGAEPVIIETKEENGWKITPEDFENAMSPKTKMIILNSPTNPTGAVYSSEELAALGEVALYEDILILSDEIYEKITYEDTKHTSIASISKELYDLTITINGFSKAYAMTGWRLGYAAAPEPIAKAMHSIQSHSTSNATSFAQYGALAALQGDQQVVDDMLGEFELRRQYMLSRLSQISNISFVEPKGAFYFLVNVSQTALSSTNFSEKLLSRAQVAVVPGIAFGNDATVRLSYSVGLDIIKSGLDRFEQFCQAH